jgi:hypothetical protein
MDREAAGIGLTVFLVVMLVIGGVFLVSYRSDSSVAELTENYDLPAELSGCRVYSLSPKGLGQTLYVVVRDGSPAATLWKTGDSKNRRLVSVGTPE